MLRSEDVLEPVVVCHVEKDADNQVEGNGHDESLYTLC